MSQLLDSLRRQLSQLDLHGYLVPTTDEHLNEYVPPARRRLEAASGFTGSAGTAVVLRDGRPQLFVDSRYHIQAEEQCSATFEIQKLGLAGVLDLPEWLQSQPAGQRFGVDPFTVSPRTWRKWRTALQESGSELVPLAGNWVDQLREHSEAFQKPPYALPLEWTGRSVTQKLTELRAELKRAKATHVLLTQLDEIAWLMNLRGSDIPCNPVFEAYALISSDQAICFTHFPEAEVAASLPEWTFLAYAEYPSVVKELATQAEARVWLDPQGVTMGTLQMFEQQEATVLEKESPVIWPRAVKNEVELARIRFAHRQAAAGKIQSFVRLQQAQQRGMAVSERQYADWLRECYAARPEFVDLSFETIAGAGANAAIVHYGNPSAEKILTDGELLLVDSGIQCGGGTTDATRTLVTGNPSEEQRRCYTLVLQAHMQLARQIFPEKTNGAVLDGIARTHLWNAGLDFGHGTGHGVGAFLGVHEGPQRISGFAGEVGFQAGMIISNEPGYYRTGWGGIRLENLYAVLPAEDHPPHPDGKRWLRFDALTLIPFERRLVQTERLRDEDWQWLRDYHARVWEEIAPLLENEAERAWLQAACDWS
jgi:Xaa-Pro aminopeptidase